MEEIENFSLLKESYVLESQFFFLFIAIQTLFAFIEIADITRIVFSGKKQDQKILRLFIPSIREIMLRSTSEHFGWKNSSDQSFARSIFRGYRSCLKVDLEQFNANPWPTSEL